MDFKVGDIVVYISHKEEWHGDAKLIIGKKYEILMIIPVRDNYYVKLKNEQFDYSIDRFITLQEYRRQKINKLKSKIYEF